MLLDVIETLIRIFATDFGMIVIKFKRSIRPTPTFCRLSSSNRGSNIMDSHLPESRSSSIASKVGTGKENEKTTDGTTTPTQLRGVLVVECRSVQLQRSKTIK